jgi:ribosomal protein S18 acetylase RimI-like enzyme
MKNRNAMIQIRNCTEADFEQIVELLSQLWPDNSLDTWKLKDVFNRGLSSGNQRYICATIDSKVIGFCSLTVKNNLWQQGYLGHIDELVVDKQNRGFGVGSQLLERIMEIAKEMGCRRVELDSGFHRVKAHSFYQQKGFKKRAYLFSKQL